MQATQFRIWATKTLKEFINKGFALDDERLKQGRHFGKDHFDGGTMSDEVAMKLADKEYEKFRVGQDSLFESDFDREINRIRLGEKMSVS